MALGFYTVQRKIAECCEDMLKVGIDFKKRFDNDSITTQEYETESIGKIYEIANRNAEGNDELEKILKSQWADYAVKHLKETIDNYEEGMGIN